MLVGGRRQGWFPLTGSQWKPPSYASYLHGAPHQPPLGTSSQAHLLVMRLNVSLKNMSFQGTDLAHSYWADPLNTVGPPSEKNS